MRGFIASTVQVTAVIVILIAAAALLTGYFGGADNSLEPARFTVVTREGERLRFDAPRAYLEERIRDGATLLPELGRSAFELVADLDTMAPCRLTEGCKAGEPGAVHVIFPHPYDIAGAPLPAERGADSPSDIDGFRLFIGDGGVEQDPDATLRYETRRYRPLGDGRVRSMSCNLVVGAGVEAGDCEAGVEWREGVYAQVRLVSEDRGRVVEAAEKAVALLDQIAAEDER